MNINPKLVDCGEKFSEAWISCMAFMVQGNLSALTLSHAGIAFKTGLGSMMAYATCQVIVGKESKTLNAILIGACTAIIDKQVHATHFGGPWTEALATGVGAGCLAFIVDHLKEAKKR